MKKSWGKVALILHEWILHEWILHEKHRQINQRIWCGFAWVLIWLYPKIAYTSEVTSAVRWWSIFTWFILVQPIGEPSIYPSSPSVDFAVLILFMLFHVTIFQIYNKALCLKLGEINSFFLLLQQIGLLAKNSKKFQSALGLSLK